MYCNATCVCTNPDFQAQADSYLDAATAAECKPAEPQAVLAAQSATCDPCACRFLSFPAPFLFFFSRSVCVFAHDVRVCGGARRSSLPFPLFALGFARAIRVRARRSHPRFASHPALRARLRMSIHVSPPDLLIHPSSFVLILGPPPLAPLPPSAAANGTSATSTPSGAAPALLGSAFAGLVSAAVVAVVGVGWGSRCLKDAIRLTLASKDGEGRRVFFGCCEAGSGAMKNYCTPD
ncbi:hypothetical protein B0H16DRAFT_1567590, partial [Mycena metata]